MISLVRILSQHGTNSEMNSTLLKIVGFMEDSIIQKNLQTFSCMFDQ